MWVIGLTWGEVPHGPAQEAWNTPSNITTEVNKSTVRSIIGKSVISRGTELFCTLCQSLVIMDYSLEEIKMGLKKYWYLKSVPDRPVSGGY